MKVVCLVSVYFVYLCMNIWIFGIIIIIINIMVLYCTVPPGDAIAKLNPLEGNYPARKCYRKCGAKVSMQTN